jgi:hypothetical protein
MATPDPQILVAGPARQPSARITRLAFYGRTARTAADAVPDQHQQARLCRAAAAACGGQISAWFFDPGTRADQPFPRRPGGQALLAALTRPSSGIDAVIATDVSCLLPRQAASGGTGSPGWLATWNTPVLLAGSGYMISSPQEFRLAAELLLGSARPPDCHAAPRDQRIRQASGPRRRR